MPEKGSQSDRMCVPVPADTSHEGLKFLESIAAGNIGGGIKMTRQGQTLPNIRKEYKTLIENFEGELDRRKAAGASAKELARWAVNERTNIARKMRARQGGGAQIVLELRDQAKYGLGGRSYDNLLKRAEKISTQRAARTGASSIPTGDLPEYLLNKAVVPNEGISNSAIKGAKFLRSGGRAVAVISISATAYILLTTPEAELEKIIYEEVGGIATSGWGLLACGVIGGGGGGILGSSAGDKIYTLKEEYINRSPIGQQGFQVYSPKMLSAEPL